MPKTYHPTFPTPPSTPRSAPSPAFPILEHDLGLTCSPKKAIIINIIIDDIY